MFEISIPHFSPMCYNIQLTLTIGFLLLTTCRRAKGVSQAMQKIAAFIVKKRRLKKAEHRRQIRHEADLAKMRSKKLKSEQDVKAKTRTSETPTAST